MSHGNPHVMALESTKAWFVKTASALEEGDSGFAPQTGMFTAAQQIAHVAQTVDWFIEGAFERPGGLDMDFESQMKKVFAVDSVSKANAWIETAFAKATKVLGAKSEAELNETFPAETIMGGMPKHSLVGGIVDHTAHHRGSIAVYLRMLGKEPPMPYM